MNHPIYKIHIPISQISNLQVQHIQSLKGALSHASLFLGIVLYTALGAKVPLLSECIFDRSVYCIKTLYICALFWGKGIFYSSIFLRAACVSNLSYTDLGQRIIWPIVVFTWPKVFSSKISYHALGQTKERFAKKHDGHGGNFLLKQSTADCL